MKAISIRQPWAWLIVHGLKVTENRTWRSWYRGPLLIHAAKGMTAKEYRECDALCRANGIRLPPVDQLQRGGIIGQVRMTDCIAYTPGLGAKFKPFFFGPYGFIFQNAEPRPFEPMVGSLGIFEARDRRESCRGRIGAPA